MSEVRDIVERLREWAEDDVRAIAKDMPTMGLKIEPCDVRLWGDLMDEAADEIARLRSQEEMGRLIIAAEKAAFAIDGIMPAHEGQAEHAELKDAFSALEAALYRLQHNTKSEDAGT